MNWQPISTAPKDGTVIDLWCVWTDTREGERVPDSHWGVSTIAFEDEEIEGWVGGYIGVDGMEAIIDPESREVTHWMPLPEPPAE
jgi:hypothetical protein